MINSKKYRSINEAQENEIFELKNIKSNSVWNQQYHITPETGLLNDPNGFVYFSGKYRLFYQWYPFGAVHGMKHWYYLESDNLIDWIENGVALIPEFEHESHGIFSGTSIVSDEKLYIYYTANKRDENWKRESTQCLALMDKEGNIIKKEEPIIPSPPNGYTQHFRDPKVFKNNEEYFMLIGAQRDDLMGCILVYKLDDIEEWSFCGELKISEKLGYMLECPDYFKIDGRDVILVSPQGIQSSGIKFNNIYNSGAIIGKFDFENLEFDGNLFEEIDNGFDFYAPQTTEAPDGRRILIAWMGLPDIVYPTDKEDWSGTLTLPREIFLKNDKICQKPIEELKLKRTNMKTEHLKLNSESIFTEKIKTVPGEYIIEIEAEENVKTTIAFAGGKEESIDLIFDRYSKKFILDRGNVEEKVAVEYGETREVEYIKEKILLNIFLDKSSIEIFANQGEFTFSSRIFMKNDNDKVKVSVRNGEANIKIKQWQY